jgi:hypothetical protein
VRIFGPPATAITDVMHDSMNMYIIVFMTFLKKNIWKIKRFILDSSVIAVH